MTSPSSETRRPTRVRGVTPGAALLLLVFLLGVCALPAAAWFFYGRNVAAVAEIASPNAIFISAGNGEDMVYLDMSGINVVGAEHRDFVFSVTGEFVNNYKLQLAYTTNNQFTYTIYPATTGTAGDNQVTYVSPLTGTPFYYKIDKRNDVEQSLAGHFLNGTSGGGTSMTDPKVATTDTYYTSTYGSYAHVDQYARPLYWQTDNTIQVAQDRRDHFVDYYIIRVTWPSGTLDENGNRVNGKSNDRETDIVYISASVVTS